MMLSSSMPCCVSAGQRAPVLGSTTTTRARLTPLRASSARLLVPRAAAKDAAQPVSAEVVSAEAPKERWSFASAALSDGGPLSWVAKLPLLAAGGFMGSNFNLDGPAATIDAILVLAAIVAVHELGHFSAARLQGIHVTKFAIGFGPTLVSYQGEEVEYSLRLFPLGGYVAFPEDSEESPYEADDPDLLRNRPIPDRALVISAGVIANCVFAASILLTQVCTVGIADPVYRPGVRVAEVMANSAALQAGLRNNDVVLSVAAPSAPPVAIMSGAGAVPQLVDSIKDAPGMELTFEVQRAGEKILLPVTTAVTSSGQGKIGVQLAANAEFLHRFPANPVEAVQAASAEYMRLLKNVTDGLGQIFSNFSQVSDSVSGPVAIVAVGANVAKQDATGLYSFAAAVNLNLAVVNVLPLPALDGGYLLLIAIEAIRGGRKLPQELETGVMASGLLLLLTSGLFLVARDIINLGVASGVLPP